MIFLVFFFNQLAMVSRYVLSCNAFDNMCTERVSYRGSVDNCRMEAVPECRSFWQVGPLPLILLPAVRLLGHRAGLFSYFAEKTPYFFFHSDYTHLHSHYQVLRFPHSIQSLPAFPSHGSHSNWNEGVSIWLWFAFPSWLVGFSICNIPDSHLSMFW